MQLERQDAGNGESSNGAIYGTMRAGSLSIKLLCLKQSKTREMGGRKNSEVAEFLVLLHSETIGSCIQNNIIVLSLHGMNRTVKLLKVKSLIFFQSVDKTVVTR